MHVLKARLTWMDKMVSPMWNTEIHSDFCEAPLRSPLSHRDLVPVGSSSTLSLTFWGSRTIDMFPNLSATINEKCRSFLLYLNVIGTLADLQLCPVSQNWSRLHHSWHDRGWIGILISQFSIRRHNSWIKLSYVVNCFSEGFKRLLSSTYLQQSKNPTYTSL